MAFNLLGYIKETRAELRHVSWPTQKQTLSFTGLVVFFSLVTAYFLGLFDFLFKYILGILIA